MCGGPPLGGSSKSSADAQRHELSDPNDLALGCDVNGQPMHDSLRLARQAATADVEVTLDIAPSS
jgi:hypothetical protein